MNHSDGKATPSSSPRDPLLFALIIGINNYQEQPHLRGAVADANAFKNYLMTSLGVDESRIISLIDEKATRAKIIEKFGFLSETEAIQPGRDPIVIFFAGHGGDAPSSPGWEAGGPGSRTQFLIAHDSSTGENPTISAIPDRTVAALLDRIAERKGNNITVILDCCHSASGTRSIRNDGIRSVPVQYSITHELDADIRGFRTRKAQIAAGFVQTGLQSHIILAACGAEESAREALEPMFRGNFTTELIKLLEATSPETLKYSDILVKMGRIPGQNPQLEGANRDGFLFGGRIRRMSSRQPSQLSQHPSSFSVGIQGGQFVLEAGTTQGITKGTRYEVYWDNNSTSGPPLGSLVVSQVFPSSATLVVPSGQPQFAIPPSAVAVGVELGQRDALRLFVSPDRPLLDLVNQSVSPSPGVVIVDDEIQAHLYFWKLGTTVKCRIAQAHYNFTHDYQDGDINTPEKMSTFIRYAARFHRYLCLSRIHSNPEMIQVEIFELESNPNYFYSAECRPISDNLNTNNILDIVVGAETKRKYGIKITNNTDQNLYPHLFYFDNSDFSIECFYSPSQTSNPYVPDSPLRSGGSLAIGYGAAGWAPISFYLPAGQDVDLGFFKFFLSTSPNDLSDIRQPSFPSASPCADGSRKAVAAPSDPLPSPIQDPTLSWGTIIIPIRQRLPHVPPLPLTGPKYTKIHV